VRTESTRFLVLLNLTSAAATILSCIYHKSNVRCSYYPILHISQVKCRVKRHTPTTPLPSTVADYRYCLLLTTVHGQKNRGSLLAPYKREARARLSITYCVKIILGRSRPLQLSCSKAKSPSTKELNKELQVL